MDIYFNVDDAPHFIATSDVYQRAMYYGSKGERMFIESIRDGWPGSLKLIDSFLAE